MIPSSSTANTIPKGCRKAMKRKSIHPLWRKTKHNEIVGWGIAENGVFDLVYDAHTNRVVRKLRPKRAERN